MRDINKSFTSNKFVDFWMSKIPDDPYTQAQYMYYLTMIVFFGLLGYAITAWVSFFSVFALKSFFSAMFMTAISLISLFGLKQTRSQYLLLKEFKNQPKKEVEDVDTMLKRFSIN